MITCPVCQTENLDRSQYCDECGSVLRASDSGSLKTADSTVVKPANITSVGIQTMDEELSQNGENESDSKPLTQSRRAKLVIERGEGAGTEFTITTDESNIGRWDADNGIFPDIDLDTFDGEAKVSRRHARVMFREGQFVIEDLGSTNGTFVNRGRRLIPGNPHVLKDGDEVIVGKTFLRFNLEIAPDK